MPIELNLLCAGAAQGLVGSLAPRLLSEAGAIPVGRFGAVGAMEEALLAGEPCDVMVSTAAMLDELVAQGRLRETGRAAIGRVRTAVAVRRGMPRPDVSSPDALAAALSAADAVYCPDLERSTAGQHFRSVLVQLGLADELGPRLRMFPNGATAMREMGASKDAHPIGCTQATEILYTDGVTLVAMLPPRFELATVYAAAIGAHAAHPEAAARLIGLLTGPGTAALRADAGFEA